MQYIRIGKGDENEWRLAIKGSEMPANRKVPESEWCGHWENECKLGLSQHKQGKGPRKGAPALLYTGPAAHRANLTGTAP